MVAYKVLFVPHCDDFSCDLGSVEYQCPKCNKFNIDFDLWWKEGELYDGKKFTIICESCNEKSEVGWDKEYSCILVK